jgi:hypothetical protein
MIYQQQLSTALKKHEAGIFISEAFASLDTSVPQILMAPDLTYIFYPALLNKKQFSTAKKIPLNFQKRQLRLLLILIFLKIKLRSNSGLTNKKLK